MRRLLLVTSPLLTGPDVLQVQRRLARLGFEPGPLDGRYGPATERAVRAFQAAAGIAADGVVGPQTRAALASAKPRPADGDPIGRRALAEAVHWLGTKENPPGSNGVPWCAIFLSYCFKAGAGYTIAAGFRGAGCGPRGCAYVPTVEAWLRATGSWIGRSVPRAGDIAIYNWDGGAPDHVGIVESADGDSFTAIEGNTATADDSDGGEVMRRNRTLDEVDGFGRIEASHSLQT